MMEQNLHAEAGEKKQSFISYTKPADLKTEFKTDDDPIN
jgi:hypothetical protein